MPQHGRAEEVAGHHDTPVLRGGNSERSAMFALAVIAGDNLL